MRIFQGAGVCFYLCVCFFNGSIEQDYLSLDRVDLNIHGLKEFNSHFHRYHFRSLA